MTQIEEVVLVHGDDIIGKSDTTMVPREGDAVMVDESIIRPNVDFKEGFYQVDMVMWKMYSHTHVAEVYLTEKQ